MHLGEGNIGRSHREHLSQGFLHAPNISHSTLHPPPPTSRTRPSLCRGSGQHCSQTLCLP